MSSHIYVSYPDIAPLVTATEIDDVTLNVIVTMKECPQQGEFYRTRALHDGSEQAEVLFNVSRDPDRRSGLVEWLYYHSVCFRYIS
jgi:hypothetical protein